MPETAHRSASADEHAGWVCDEFARVADDVAAEHVTAEDGPVRRPRTARRWNLLIRLARADLSVARLVEAHLDALTINAELAGPRARRGQRWGVWAAEPPNGRVMARPSSRGGWRLSGTKRWCSGVGMCTNALVTAHADDGRRSFAVALDQVGVSGVREWAAEGMAATATGTVEFADVAATAVGPPRAYLDRPGFWHGALGVASCWYGGALGVIEPLRAAARADKLDAHGLAHLGAADSALHGAGCALRAAAEHIDEGALGEKHAAQREALRVRSIVESAATTAVDRAGRALGPGPLAHDAPHARCVSDLTVYLRQSHAERDLAELGGLVGAAEPGAL